MWRPDDWDSIVLETIDKMKAQGTPDLTRRALIEAGADAILTALLKKGMRTDAFRTHSCNISMTNPKKRGWYVFIEKVK